jgi:hypothetical protein
MWLTLMLLAIFAACGIFLSREGMWGSAVMLINVVFAAMLASNYFEKLAKLLEAPPGADPNQRLGGFTYFLDFLTLWFLFAFILGILRLATGYLSSYRVRFRKPVEIGGRIFFSLWIGWVMVGFTIMTLHTAPLPRDSFGGAFQKTPMSGNFLGMAPGRQWLAFMQSRSRGALSRSDEKAKSSYDEDRGMRVFDPHSEFIVKYRQRRATYEKARGPGYLDLRVRRD